MREEGDSCEGVLVGFGKLFSFSHQAQGAGKEAQIF
jgi:hypothetical protein